MQLARHSIIAVVQFKSKKCPFKDSSLNGLKVMCAWAAANANCGRNVYIRETFLSLKALFLEMYKHKHKCHLRLAPGPWVWHSCFTEFKIVTVFIWKDYSGKVVWGHRFNSQSPLCGVWLLKPGLCRFSKCFENTSQWRPSSKSVSIKSVQEKKLL